MTGTSSMPWGWISGWPTPTPGGSQAWLENTWLYRRTIAVWRSTPTVYSTVSTAIPGRLIEYTCLTPSISSSFCSSGVLTSCSTSRALAPTNGTDTFAVVTAICGSSSRGVISTATSPSSRPMIARTGVSGLDWNAAARRPDKPSRATGAASLMSGPCGGLALRGQRLQRGDRVGGDLVAGLEPGYHLDLP